MLHDDVLRCIEYIYIYIYIHECGATIRHGASLMPFCGRRVDFEDRLRPGVLRGDFEAEAMEACEELMQRAEQHSAKEVRRDVQSQGA